MGKNEELVMRIQGGEDHLMDELWRNNRGLIRHVAARYRSCCGQHCDTEDLLQTGYLGLYVAAHTYSPNRGASFSTFAVYHLRRAMCEAVGLRKKRDPILDSAALDAPLDDDGDTTLLDLIPAPPDEYSVERDDLARIMRAAVAKVKPDRLRETVEAIYWDKQSPVDYAASEGITREAVYDRLLNAYELLRKNPSVVSLAIAEGYNTEPYRGTSPETAAIQKDMTERERAGLFRLLRRLVDLHGS